MVVKLGNMSQTTWKVRNESNTIASTSARKKATNKEYRYEKLTDTEAEAWKTDSQYVVEISKQERPA